MASRVLYYSNTTGGVPCFIYLESSAFCGCFWYGWWTKGSHRKPKQARMKIQNRQTKYRGACMW